MLLEGGFKYFPPLFTKEKNNKFKIVHDEKYINVEKRFSTKN